MKVLATCLVVISVVVAASSAQELHKAALAAIKPHVDKNYKFAELEAGYLNAMEASEDTNAIPARNPMSEIVAMTDMMIIQTQNEYDDMVTAFNLRTVEVTGEDSTEQQNLPRLGACIASSQTTMDTRNTEAFTKQGEWRAQLPNIPVKEQQIATTLIQIGAEEDTIAESQRTRDNNHATYLQAIKDHDKCLDDLRNIRLLLQKSALDNSANVAATNGDGFLEIKKNAHRRLRNLLELADSTASKGGSMDFIYKLIYQMRDQLVLAKEELIKEEKEAVANWKKNKLSMRAGINDARILKAEYYTQLGVIHKTIGIAKENEGALRVEYVSAMTRRDDCQIDYNFLDALWTEEKEFFYTDSARLTNELTALKSVQDTLKTLKWSDKVYKAISDVKTGVLYLAGNYNIRSAFGDRYMTFTNISGTPRAQFNESSISDSQATAITKASVFKVVLQEDISFGIVFEIASATDATKKMQYYLEETNNRKITFSTRSGERSSWRVEFDDASKKMLIKNVATKNTLYVDDKRDYQLTTKKQSVDKHSEFSFERTTYALDGCFKDQGQKLEYYAGAVDNLNTDSCFDLCTADKAANKFSQDFDYFAIQARNQCFCGSQAPSIRAPLTDCNWICDARDGDMCGAEMRLNVYETVTGDKNIIFKSKTQKAAEDSQKAARDAAKAQSLLTRSPTTAKPTTANPTAPTTAAPVSRRRR